MREPLLIRDLKMPAGHSESDLIAALAHKAGLPASAIGPGDIRLLHQSLDARDKNRIQWHLTAELFPRPLVIHGVRNLLADYPERPDPPRAGALRPVVAGAGPAGLFAALYLALAGRRPLLLERGRRVAERQVDVARFWQSGRLDANSNVQFGEGGAGTFSDGKLTTGIKDCRCRAVLEELVLAGAPESLLYLAKPHVGTDRLRQVIVGLREKILGLGGEIRYSCRLTGLVVRQDHLTGLQAEQTESDGRLSTVELPVRQLILAVGHSARDTLAMLGRLPVPLARKPFSIDLRIEHDQRQINRSQYGRAADEFNLPPADYKLACHLDTGRSLYTFCMCPGGQVIAAASETGGIVTNGMSHQARNQVNANSALLVGVNPEDFPGDGPLAGMDWQRTLEQAAFRTGGGDYRAPAQRVGDFLAAPGAKGYDGASASGRIDPLPTYQPGVHWCDLSACLPPFVLAAMRAGLPLLDRKLRGFTAPTAVLTGLETRSSSPVRVLRDERLQSGLAGLYPAGEGAGYAGGIMSAAVDGLRCAEAVLRHQD